MADLSDVTNAIADLVAAACYPNGTDQPSVSGAGIVIEEGWPRPGQLDEARKLSPSPSLVSIWPMGATTFTSDQFWEAAQLIAAPVHGMTISVSGTTVALAGTPNVGEYASIIVNGLKGYSQAAQAGDTAASLAAGLAAQIQADAGDATSFGTTVSIPSAHALTARIGAAGTMGQALHRQRQMISVIVWAPDPATRSRIASAIDVAMKRSFRLAMPDTSQALVWFDRTAVIDDEQDAGIYRRDLVYVADYATVDEYPAYEVTITDTTIDPGGPPVRTVQ